MIVTPTIFFSFYPSSTEVSLTILAVLAVSKLQLGNRLAAKGSLLGLLDHFNFPLF